MGFALLLQCRYSPAGTCAWGSSAQRVKSKKRRSASINKNFIAQFLRVLKRGCGKREYLDFAALAGLCDYLAQRVPAMCVPLCLCRVTCAMRLIAPV